MFAKGGRSSYDENRKLTIKGIASDHSTDLARFTVDVYTERSLHLAFVECVCSLLIGLTGNGGPRETTGSAAQTRAGTGAIPQETVTP